MAVLDLKDAYYSVPINPQHRSTSDLSLKILSMSLHVYQMVSPRPQGCLQKL